MTQRIGFILGGELHYFGPEHIAELRDGQREANEQARVAAVQVRQYLAQFPDVDVEHVLDLVGQHTTWFTTQIWHDMLANALAARAEFEVGKEHP
jgi:hypothetical protein